MINSDREEALGFPVFQDISHLEFKIEVVEMPQPHQR
jgi:hypothetical protein